MKRKKRKGKEGFPVEDRKKKLEEEAEAKMRGESVQVFLKKISEGERFINGITMLFFRVVFR